MSSTQPQPQSQASLLWLWSRNAAHPAVSVLHATGRYSRASLRLSAFVVVLLSTTVVGTLALPPIGRFSRPLQWRLGAQLVSWFMRQAGRILAVRVTYRGVPPPPGALVVANHRSYIDGILLAQHFPAVYLCKAEVRCWPIVGWGASLVGTAFVKRRCKVGRSLALQEALERLAHGMTVVNFPEGTTLPEPQVGQFRPGLFHALAARAEAHAQAQPSPPAPLPPVAPVALRYRQAAAAWVGKDSFVRHLVATASRSHTDAQVDFLPLLQPQHVGDGDQLCQAAQQRIASTLG